MRKYFKVILILTLLLIFSQQVFSQEGFLMNTHDAALLTGTVIGLGVTTLDAVLLFGYTPDVPITTKFIAWGISSGASIVTSILTTELFFNIFSTNSLNKWLSIPLGALAGGIEGALIGGVTYGVFFAVMQGIYPSFINAENINNLWDAAWMGFIGGSVFGGLIGIIPGAGVAVLVRFTYGEIQTNTAN